MRYPGPYFRVTVALARIEQGNRGGAGLEAAEPFLKEAAACRVGIFPRLNPCTHVSW